MKTKIGLPFGLALVMFLGVFTTMLAFGVLSPDRADAAAENATVTLEVDYDAIGGTPGEVMISFTNDTSAINADGTLVLAFQGATIDENEGAEDDNWSVVVDPAGDEMGETTLTGVTVERGSATAVTLTLADNIRDADTDVTPNIDEVPPVPAGAMVTIKFTADTDTQTPVGIQLDGTGINIDGATTATMNAVGVTVGNAPSDATSNSTVILDGMKLADFSVDNTVKRPGAVSGYRFTFTTRMDLVANQDVITVHFDKDFKGHGTSLSKSHVTVSSSAPDRGEDASETNTAITGATFVLQTGAFNPDSDASLDTLTSAKHHLPNKDALNNIEYQVLVPDMNGTSDGAPGIRARATVTVVISPAAGITNATEGGDKGPLGVSTTKQTTLAYDTVEVTRGISLSSYASNRNKSLTVSGSGFQNGTSATIYHQLDDDPNNSLRQSLVSVSVASNDTFEAQINVTVPPFVPGTENWIYVEDGNQPPFTGGPIQFEVEGLLTVSPTSAAVGDEVDITLEDWPNNDPIPTNAVTIAGVPQTIIGSPSLSGGSANFRIEISTETPSGTDEIKVTIGNENDTQKITIAGADLSANPTTAVPNQAVTVTGRGFTAQRTIGRTISGVNDSSSVTFGNSDLHLEHGSRNFNNGQFIEVDSGGNWSASIIIPITSASTSPGIHKLEVKDDGNRTGSFDITVPQRTLTIDPPEARPGETVTLTGVGFPATNTRSKAQNTPPVSIIYGDSGIVGTATPDADGNISMTFRVPLDANIPSTNRVEANYTVTGLTEVRTHTNHEVPGARISLSMEEGKPGDTLTITGDGFKAFASVEYVKIGGIDVTPAPKPATNRNGEFTAIILVPDLADGTNAIDVKVGVTASANFKVLEAAATTMMPEVMMAEAATPDVAFAAVIAEDNLIAVYHFDPATQNEAPNYGYTVYDARPLFMSGNNLDSIEPGQFYTVQVSEDQMGVTLGSQTVDLYAPFTPIRW